MATRANGAFEITGWEGSPYDEREGATLTRAHLTKTYSGDLRGEGTTDLLFAQAREGSGAYAGFERFVGSVRGRHGSFVLHHSESSSRGERPEAATVGVVPDSGTGELRHIRGEAQIVVDEDGGHAFTLDYDLE